jgi:hypothetical protein
MAGRGAALAAMRPPMDHLIIVHAAFDEEAQVWYIESSDPLRGLNLEAETLDQLRDKIPGAITDLLDTKIPGREIAVQMVAHTHMGVRVPAAAA